MTFLSLLLQNIVPTYIGNAFVVLWAFFTLAVCKETFDVFTSFNLYLYSGLAQKQFNIVTFYVYCCITYTFIKFLAHLIYNLNSIF